MNPAGEDLGTLANGIRGVLASATLPAGINVDMRGMVQGMQQSFTSFALGLILALVLLYLILVAQFRSFTDPFLILLAVPTGLTGVLVALFVTGTTLNVQSLMGVLMMVGMVVSNSILIVEFTHRLEEDGMPLLDAVVNSCRIRLRPILMTSLATIFGLIPMALKLGTGSEAYAPLARAIIGGLRCRWSLTVFIVPAAYLIVYRRRSPRRRSSRRDASHRCALCIALVWLSHRGPATPSTSQRLSLKEAEQRALDGHPQVRAGRSAALARRPGRARSEVRLLADRLRQRHRRGARPTARASRPARSTTRRSSIDSRRASPRRSSSPTSAAPAISCRRRSCAPARRSRTRRCCGRKCCCEVDRAYFDALRAQAVAARRAADGRSAAAGRRSGDARSPPAT